MASITKNVWDKIDQDVIVKSAIEKEIISMKNLAVYLIKKYKLDATNDAVISAIRRYKKEDSIEKKFQDIRRVLSKSRSIKVTSNISKISLEKNKHINNIIDKAFNKIDTEQGDILLVIQGEKTIQLICNDKNKDKILSLFPKNLVLNTNDDLAEINIHLSDEAFKVPGILSLFTTELMLHNINMAEMTSCMPELLFFVKQEHAVKTYEVFFNLCYQNKK